MKPPEGSLERVASWLGLDVGIAARRSLERYADWLVDEALELGGIGPSEPDRIWDRHVLDSLLFLKDLSPGASVLDVGSGVGLPGIPIAVVHDGPVTLLDRSGRRTDALRRIAAVLSLDVEVVQGDVFEYALEEHQPHDRVVMRAAVPVETARRLVRQLCGSQGELWIAIGRNDDSEALMAWRARPRDDDVQETLVGVGSEVLDSPAWLLRMAAL